MKLIKFLAMMLMAVTMSFGMTACGDDDDDDDNGGFGGGVGTATYTVSADKLEIVYEIPSIMKSVETATFEGDKCTSWKNVQTYASENYADKAWNDLQSEFKDLFEDIYSKNGKVITMDHAKIAGLDIYNYESVKDAFEGTLSGYEKIGVKVIRK